MCVTEGCVLAGCPRGIPLMSCDGNPCDDAACPSHPSAVCTPNYCGECVAEWYVGDSLVECNANDIPNVCEKPFNSSGEDFLHICRQHAFLEL